MVEHGNEKSPEKEDLRSKVLKLKDLVAYQDGTVASRTLVNKKAGTITIFSFDEGEGSPSTPRPMMSSPFSTVAARYGYGRDIPVEGG